MPLSSKIADALQIAGLPALTSPELDVKKLGEGAWHIAYLLQLADGRQMVLRFQKEESYCKPLHYDEKLFRSEYGAQQLYYAYANKVQPGVCPEDFFYHVSEHLTFTIESYAGPTVQLSALDTEGAYEVGKQIGVYFRAVDEVPVEIQGFGFLEWDGEKIHGAAPGDAHANLREEIAEYREELQALLDSELSFARDAVLRTFEGVAANRLTDDELIVLTNRDLSPENLVLAEGRVRIIDPLPLAYSNMVFAGNFLNCYRNLFPSFHKAPRYERHNFHLYRTQLTAIADGFLDAYSDGDLEHRKRINGEHFFMLLSLVYRHYSLLQQQDLNMETTIRYGTREAIAERLPLLLQSLECFEL